MAVTRFGTNDASTAKTAGGKVKPINVIAPVISGSVGGILSVDTGTWINGPNTYSYHWQYNGVNIGGATSNTFNSASYTAAPISVRVIATNADGFTGASAYLVQVGGVDPIVPPYPAPSGYEWAFVVENGNRVVENGNRVIELKRAA